MRTRTAYCLHGFLIPGKPEPWTIPAKDGGAELKASRFCLKCWEVHGAVFMGHGYPPIEIEDPVRYGFLDIVQQVLKAYAWYRDQGRYEDLEAELRIHLLSKRAEVEEVLRDRPDGIAPFLRAVLTNRLRDVQRGLDARAEQNSTSYEDTVVDAVEYGTHRRLAPDDENDLSAKIIDATDSGITGNDLADVENKIADQLVESEGVALAQRDPLPRTAKSRAKENAQLLRRAIEEQSHRIDALQVAIQQENQTAVNKAHRELMNAIDTLPPDEQRIIRMRFLDGNDLRDGKPRPRPDILRELRLSGNGYSKLSEWDLRRLEQQAVFRLRSKVRLPAVFKSRDA